MYGQPFAQPPVNPFAAQREESSSGGLAPNLTDRNFGDIMAGVAGRGGIHVQFFYTNVLIESADPTVNGTFKPRLCILKMPKGDRLTVAARFISEEQAMREFPREYHAFTSSEEMPTDGTPLRELPGIAQSQLAMLALYQLRSIEDLAETPQERINSMGLEIITAAKLARAWLRNKTENKGMIEEARTESQRDAELEMMRRRLAALEKSNVELEAQNRALTTITQQFGTAPAPVQHQPMPGNAVQYAPVTRFAEEGELDLPDDPNFMSGGIVDGPDDLNLNNDPLGIKNLEG